MALIGCGGSAAVLIKGAARLQHARFTAAADGDRGAAKSAAESLGAVTVASSLDDLLRDHSASFDAVAIAGPNSEHASLVRKAATAGKHVLVLAPLATTVADADAAIDASRRAGVRLMVGHAERSVPMARAVKDAVAKGELGSPGLVRIHRWIGSDHTGEDWESDAAKSGGLALHKLGPDLDLFNWLFMGMPTNVYAVGRSLKGGKAIPDYVQVHLGFPDGGMAMLDLTTVLPPGDGYFSLSVIGSTGAAYADDHHNTHLLYQGGRPRSVISSVSDLHGTAMLNEFANAIRDGREPASAGADSRAAILVAGAVAESLSTGQALRREGDGYVLA